MILIDKEKFIEEVRKRKYSAASIKLIEEQPEVKAIPIEWMKNYARKICTDDDGRYNSKAYGIDRMIYDWEKENESIRSDI